MNAYDFKLLIYLKSDQKCCLKIFESGGEQIDLVRPQPCTGAVEDWLNKLVDVQRDTMRHVLDLAKASSENWAVEEPREKWLFSYPAQMALTASQILWCEEVN